MNGKSIGLLVRLTVVIWLLGALGRGAAGQSVFDDFNSSKRNAGLWAISQTGGPVVWQKGGKVFVEIPETSSGDAFGAGYGSNPWIAGDFDIQVDYALPVWRYASGVRVGLSVAATDGSAGMAVERISFGDNDFEGAGYPTDAYLAHYPPDNPQGVTETLDGKGTLRMTRAGDIVTSYYLDSQTSQWVQIHSAQAFDGPVHFGISAWSHDYCFTKQRVRVAFDNFRINRGAVILPITPVGLETPLARLAPEGTAPEYPKAAFGRENLPLRLRQIYGGQAMTSPEVNAPKIVALYRDGRSLDISTMNLDAKSPNSRNLAFAAESKWWVFCMRTKKLASGKYTLTIEMSDGRRYDAGFELK